MKALMKIVPVQIEREGRIRIHISERISRGRGWYERMGGR